MAARKLKTEDELQKTAARYIYKYEWMDGWIDR